MKLLSFLLFLLLFQGYIFSLAAQHVYRTATHSNQIKSLQVIVADNDISIPYIKLNGQDQIEINFDLMNDHKRMGYKIIHCNADWKQSTLSPMEYISGFQGLPIDDYGISLATTVEYTNYRLRLPNEDTKLKVSGNYAVEIYDEDEPNKIICTACFSVVDTRINITASVSSSTTIDFNKEHQQVSFSIDHKAYPIPHPATDLKVYVYQNNRQDNFVTGLKPMSILDNKIIYEHNRDLIFEAGNEYRRIEFLTHRYNGIGVDHIQFHNPYYHVVLQTDLPRSNQSYSFDRDQNGRFFIRCSGCNDSDSEADYYIVHFALESNRQPGGNVYLNGEMFNNVLNNDSRMLYNTDSGMYEKFVLLKGGNYNYQYIFLPDNQQKASTRIIEGNYYQTENEYTIAVYYRPMGSRYDQLIGTVTVDSGNNL